MTAAPLRRSRRRLVVVLVLLAVAVVAVVAAFGYASLRVREGGPLLMESEKTMAGSQANVGQRTMYGWPIVKNGGTQPIELRSARLLPEPDHPTAALVETRVGGTQSDGAGPWPTEDTRPDNTEPLPGHILQPGEERAIIFVLQLREQGHTRWTRMDVTYRVGGKTYRIGTDNGYQVCTPIDATPTGCLDAIWKREQASR